ncbi:TPA: hypothetical protein ACHU0M_004551, partial [Shigella flexneri]
IFRNGSFFVHCGFLHANMIYFQLNQLDMILPLISLMKVWGGGNAISVENSVFVMTGSFTAFLMPENVH